MHMDTSITCDEELGEMICDKCNGEGRVRYSDEVYISSSYLCSKCRGKGKVDWVENILGVKLPKLRGFFTYIDDNSFKCPVEQFIIDTMTKQIAEDLDNEILRSLKNHSEQNENEQIRGKSYDNRVFSELMFHTFIKPEI